MAGVLGEEDAGFDVVKSAVVLRDGWLVLRGRMVLGVEWDVVKSTVMLRRGWLVLQGRMAFGVGCRVGCC